MRGSTERIVDANANRAREALRTLEDLARFVLNDATLAEGCKGARHDLRAAVEDLPIDTSRRLAARDAAGDPGRLIETRAEQERASMRAVALAAGARAGEALRSLEEAAKLLGGVGRAFEAIRYRVYDLEKHIALSFGAGRGTQWRLCVLITEEACSPAGGSARDWSRVAELAIEGGADCVQLREKDLPDRTRLVRARRLVEIARAGGASCIINDSVSLALASGADGVHLGQDDLPLADARAIAGDRLLIGVSTSNMEHARAAAAGGADVCGLGPMFPSSTKPKPALAGPEYLSAYLADPASARVPHLAISGITADNLPGLVERGCRGIAVCGAVCGRDDPRAAAAELVAILRD
ncbi:MAG: thiamine phosphate synthase [Phycisphaerales bacterium JB037]